MAISYVDRHLPRRARADVPRTSPSTSRSSPTWSPARSSGQRAPPAARHADATRAASQRAAAFYLIATGLFKKVVIANYLATTIVDGVRRTRAALVARDARSAIYAYAVQIYADFSGYTDIAIGLALLLGFRFPQNFDSPYAAVVAAGLLASLAHDAVAVAARLPVHPARRQPRRPTPHVPQPDADDADRRPVARRRLDVRRLGRDPRGRPVRRALAAHEHRGPWRSRRHAASPVPARLLTFHIVCFAWMFFRADSFDVAWE